MLENALIALAVVVQVAAIAVAWIEALDAEAVPA